MTNKTKITIPEKSLAKIPMSGLYFLCEGFAELCDSAGEQHSSDLAYELFALIQGELISREPKTPADALYKIMGTLREDDIVGSGVGGAEAYKGAQDVLGLVA